MKKFTQFLAISSLMVVMVACGEDNGNNDDTVEAEETDEQVETEVNNDETEEAENDFLAVEDIVKAAMEAEANLQSAFRHNVMTMGIDADVDENITEEEEGVAQEEEILEYTYVHEDGSVSTRTERIVEGQPTEYTADDSEYSLQYTEGEDIAYRVEMFDVEGDPADIHPMNNQFEQYLENYDVVLEGEEEVNGYTTYHVSFTGEEEVLHYWFDQETYEVIRMENEDEQNPFRITLDVIEYEHNIDYDEAFFLLEDVMPEDIDIEERDTEEHLDEEMNDIIDELEEENEE
ncbi:hypothetical protein [Alkalihalobacillus trypoxylicola]|uniref:MucB/RseB N-terminal domain-containing protein n=1 Tax=Alkalihalobacillus trypoxylicola TaxID=519424 RepID=A0A162DGV8_9BACI|nr:hypothetical protein [Alkalihalobacillus trypoxylicola]KYG29594.1 hypothetical protein AZF04_08755 [Alkalihalobacillus trypoxylicola]